MRRGISKAEFSVLLIALWLWCPGANRFRHLLTFPDLFQCQFARVVLIDNHYSPENLFCLEVR